MEKSPPTSPTPIPSIDSNFMISPKKSRSKSVPNARKILNDLVETTERNLEAPYRSIMWQKYIFDRPKVRFFGK